MLIRSAKLDRHLEQQLSYRLRAYVDGGRNQDSIFTLSGLRSWMLCQAWPTPSSSAELEVLAVLGWSAICAIDDEPEQEVAVRGELGRQLDYLHGASVRRPASLDAFHAQQARQGLYRQLQRAAEPGSSRRAFFGLPRFNPKEPDHR